MPPVPPQAPEPRVEPPTRPHHVLVVDDDGDVRDYVAAALAQAGYRVTDCPDGASALEVCRRDPPRIVVTDLAMRPMSGRDLLEALRTECPSAVAVVLTGFGSVASTVELMRLGAFDVLTKPCGPDVLAVTVAKALQHQQALASNRELRDQLRVQEKLAMIGKLAAGVAHELNNPLDATLRCVRLTRERVDGDTAAREYLEMAETGMVRMAEIVQSLLTFSRHAAVEQAPQALGELIEEAVTSVALALGEEAPTIERDVPCAVARVLVPRGLHQVLTNLLRNACDATEAQGPVSVRAEERDEHVEIAVEDRGPGIPEEILPRVFEPFFTTKAPGRGTGLGLPISLRLVEKFGGGLTVRCPPGGGTVVVIRIPLPRFALEPASESA